MSDALSSISSGPLGQSNQIRLHGWYYDDDEAAGGKILKDAFRDALSICETELDPGNFSRLRTLLDSKTQSSTATLGGQIQTYGRTDMNAFADLLSEAQSVYSLKRTSGNKIARKARFWLEALAARVVHYGNIMDVLVQHHPEYVSLIWGTFKILFTAVMNHEELLAKLSKYCAQFCDLLPQEKLLSILYPTADMKRALALVYASIMKFVQQAVRFYKEGRFKHAFKSLLQPWKLRFQDVSDELMIRSKRVTELASTCAKAELRDMHLELIETRKSSSDIHAEVRALQSKLRGLEIVFEHKMEAQAAMLTSLKQEIKLDFSQQSQAVGRIHLNQLLAMPVWQQLPSSGVSLEYCVSMRRRRLHRAKPYSIDPSLLQRWSFRPESSLLIVGGHRHQVLKDFMTDMAFLIQTTDLPVFWAFRFPDHWTVDFQITDIVRMLVVQALQSLSGLPAAAVCSLTASHLHEASTLRDWLAILTQAMKHFSRAFILLDSDLLAQASRSDRHEIAIVLEHLRTQGATSTKIIVPFTGVHEDYLTRLLEEEQTLELITVDQSHGPKGRNVRQSPKSRGRRNV